MLKPIPTKLNVIFPDEKVYAKIDLLKPGYIPSVPELVGLIELTDRPYVNVVLQLIFAKPAGYTLTVKLYVPVEPCPLYKS